MSQSKFRLMLLAPLAAMTLAGGLFVVKASAAEPNANSDSSNRETVRLHRYAHVDGKNFFALCISPPAEALAKSKATARRDVVILVDTSASQIGRFREKSLAALEALLARLGDDDHVQLFAADLDAVAMTDAPAAPRGDAMKKAVEKLRSRAPLGATDMEIVLQTALKSFGEKAENARALVYIGDGVTAANLSASKNFRKTLARFVSDHIAVSSFAIGARRDELLLAAVANQTGGMVAVDGSDFSADQAGDYLAKAVAAEVIWPESVAWPKTWTVYPSQLNPLRGDRETVVVGTGPTDGTETIAIRGASSAGPVAFDFTTPAAVESKEDNAFLISLIDRAKVDGGTSLPTLGAGGLAVARGAAYRDAEFLAESAGRAISMGNLTAARPMLAELRRLDPSHPQLAALELALQPKAKKSLEQEPSTQSADSRAPQPKLKSDAGQNDPPRGAKAVGRAHPKRANVFRMVAFQQPAEDEPLPEGAGGAEDLFDEVESNRRANEDRIRTEVEVILNDARRMMRENPQQAMEELKLKLQAVKMAPELSGGVQSQLADKLTTALRQAEGRKLEIDKQRAIFAAAEAARRERQRILDGLLTDQVRVEQLMRQFNTLMDEGRYDNTMHALAEQMAEHIDRIQPDTYESTAAIYSARLTGAYRESLAVYNAHQKGTNAMLLQCDISGTPYSDNPPITYPPADQWQELTDRRRAYARVDLQSQGGAEVRIFKALDEVTSLQLIQTPLSEFANIVKQKHDIEVQIDARAIEDEGLDPNLEITKELSGITLRSALRLILRAENLTFVVENEVLMITTQAKAGQTLTTKVYPVADLVLPITEATFPAGFGDLSNFQGGGDQGGGGGGGFGGGGGGGAGF